jgi:hypothetical protein
LVELHDKSGGGAKDIVDIGKFINFQFKEDTSNMFQVLSCPSNSLRRRNDAGGISMICVEGDHGEHHKLYQPHQAQEEISSHSPSQFLHYVLQHRCEHERLY